MAIDKHLIPRHDRDNMSHLIRSKPKGGTGKFECYATMHVVYQQTKFQGIVKYFFHVQGYAHSKWYNQ